ncbi:DUF4180 domain-containing protein [Chromobacterium sp. CV08]|uniref:DUF4180 domain-containing protein n=1 Tax=Chromobacterium sp. CV08 TaxID=3133274 RepID=UPI003DA8EA37
MDILSEGAMEYRVFDAGGSRALEWLAPLEAASQAVDLVAACAGEDCGRLLLDAAVLPAAFFQLRTRFAGEFLQKLQNYKLRTAVVIGEGRSDGERFGEFLAEARRGHGCRLFLARGEALLWLADRREP